MAFARLLSTLLLAGQFGSQDPFIASARHQIDEFASRLPAPRAEYWRSQTDSVTLRLGELHLQQEEVRRGFPEHLLHYLQSRQIEDLDKLQLGELSRIHYAVGREMLDSVLIPPLEARLRHLQGHLASFRGPARVQLADAYRELLGAVDRVGTLRLDPDPRHRYDLRETGVFTSRTIETYRLLDWIAWTDSASMISRDMDRVAREIEVVRYIAPRDPRSWLTILVNATLLLASIAGYLISYTERPSVTVVAGIATVSLSFSVLLIFLSGNTAVNLLLQCIVPSGFVLYWVRNNRRRASHSGRTVAQNNEPPLAEKKRLRPQKRRRRR